MRSFLLINLVFLLAVFLSWNAVPAEPRQTGPPEHPWRHTAEGWVRATWLPAVASDPVSTAEPLSPPVRVPHPLLLAALQVLAIAFATVAEWPHARKREPVTA